MKILLIGFGIMTVLIMGKNAEFVFEDELEECGKNVDVSLDQIEEMIAVKDPKMGCISECVLKELGAMDGDEIDKDTLMSLLDQKKDSLPNYDETAEALSTCYAEETKPRGSGCEVAGRLLSCLHEKLNEE